jgi:hypothetical protein
MSDPELMRQMAEEAAAQAAASQDPERKELMLAHARRFQMLTGPGETSPNPATAAIPTSSTPQKRPQPPRNPLLSIPWQESPSPPSTLH